MARRKHTNIAGQTDLFEFLTPESEETRDERLRSYREDQLDASGPEPVRSAGESRAVLSEPGVPGRGPDRPATAEPGRAGQSERGLPGQVGETERGEAASRGDRDLRGADPAEGSVGDRSTGRVGDTGPDVDRDQPADRPAGTGSGPETGVDEDSFIPASPDDLAPSGTQARFQANLTAIQTLRRIEAEDREATTAERQELARWGSWGATGLSEVFNPARPEFEAEREELRQELSEDEYRAAERTVLNAHYTDPRVAQAMWQAMNDFGFESGRVLEPGSGSGTFIGTAPEGAEMTGVELDPVTAAISQAVYPNATIRTESFADTAVPDGYFDVVIGNVPFGQNVLHDPRHNPDRHSMHNHFILKSLDLVKPGGIVGVISSTYTLDAQNSAARQAMHEKADLLTAVRLPNRTFQRSAGTDVATDVLFFRKRHEHETPGNDGWVHTREQRISFGDQEATVRLNQAFFTDDLEGEFIIRPRPDTDRFGNPAATYPSANIDTSITVLGRTLNGAVTRRRNQGLTYDPTPASDAQAMPLIVPDEQNLLDGHITDQGEGVFTIYRQGVQHPLEVPATQRAELSALLGLRDQARRLISAEAQTTTDTEDIATTRRGLSDAYAAYVASYGPINRIKESTTAKGAITRRSAPVMAKLNKDPYGPLVRSLEVYDNATGTAVPASLLSERVLEQRTTITRAESPADALAISLDQTGGVDLDYIADLLETDPQTARDRLGETVFDVPGEHGRLETREAYLSGDVRAKLEAAEAAAVENPALSANVEALREVVPTDLQPSEIEARVGASWIPDTVHTQFLREVTGDTTATMRRVSGASWDYSGSRLNRGGWGTEKFPAHRLLGLMAEQKAIIAYHPADQDGHRAVDTQETAMANERAENLAERFSEWVWEDPERASTLAAEYNRTFNNLVLRNYEKAGQALTLPGLVKNFAPRQHQRTAVARMLNEPSVGLFHQVGAGKAQPLDSLVLTPRGFVRMGDVVPGTQVVTPSGDVAPVSKVFPQGKRPIYRVTFNDGSSVEADEDHLWEVQTSCARAQGTRSHVLTTNELRGDLTKKNGSTKWYLPNITAVDLEADGERPLDPYLLGLLLGDGSMRGSSLRFSTADVELVDAVRDALPPGAVMRNSGFNNGYDWNIVAAGPRYSADLDPDEPLSIDDSQRLAQLHSSGVSAASLARATGAAPSTVRRRISQHVPSRPRSKNPALVAVRALGLNDTTSATKFVPSAYKNAPITVRHAVLQGLLDTDGTVSTRKKGERRGVGVSFVSASSDLAADVAWLVRSLGGRATLREIRKTYTTRTGVATEGIYHYVGIALPNEFQPFRITRKAERVIPRRKYQRPRLGITSIEPIGQKEAQCIVVDHPTHLYITDNFTATHNTAEMVMGTMELKRLGMVNKPAVVVPNHMLEQFSREWLGMYPQAKLLTASSEDLRGDDRRAFVARTATGDWDAIILTHSAFSRIPMAPENQSAYLDREVAIQRENLEKSVARAEENGESTGRSTKQLQRRIQAIEERTKALQDTDHDDGLTFEETGIDYLCVDELHEFKNLETVSQIQDASIAGSQKATDLHMKIDYLRAQHGDRVITGATGTPIANSMSEMHVMTRFLRPDLLEAAGLHDFDSWAATFGSVVREMEMTVAGGDSFHMKERFAKFQNVPELLRMFHTFGDVKLQEDLNLPVPQIAARASDGQRTPETLVVQPSEAQKQYVQDMADRYELVTKGSVDPRIDNALKITSDGRKAAADLRLLGDEAPIDDGQSQTKAEATADLLAKVYDETKDNQYLIAGTDQVHPTPGALQVVFCDLGTPKADEDQFSLYDELKTQCAARGIPEDKIRFVHEATNDAKKARLFEQCRSGDVAVLIGSTQKMGVGTNIQARLAHLVHMDCPWRPADVEQRNGRILRQGNQNDEVRLTQVVTKGSVEPFMWQTVERKSAFTNQAMRGRLDVREIEDIGDSTMSFAEVKALATGNPLLIEKSNADQQLSKLERLERGHRQDQSALQFSKAGWVSESTRLQEEIPQLREAAQRTTETAGEKFRMTVPGHGETLTDRTKAAEALAGWANANGSHRPPLRGEADLGTCATLGGHDLRMVQGPGVMGDLDSSPVRIDIADAPGVSVETSRKETLTPHRGLITRIENQISSLNEKADQRAARVEKLEASIADADQRLGKPFEKAADLEVARQNVAELDKKLRAFQAGNPSSGGVEQTGTQTALGASSNGPEAPGQTAVMDPPETESGMSQDDIDQMRTLLGRDFPQNPGTNGPTQQGNPYDPGHGPETEIDRDTETGLD
jgi:N12 class adenine-specific DNA methylase